MFSELTSFVLFGKNFVVTPWEIFGFLGVSLFSARWFVQIYYSHIAGRPVTPRIFWLISVVGSLITLTYFLFRPGLKFETVGVLGNLFPSFIATYNLYLDFKHSFTREASKEKVEKLERIEKHEKAEKKAAMASLPVPAAVND